MPLILDLLGPFHLLLFPNRKTKHREREATDRTNLITGSRHFSLFTLPFHPCHSPHLRLLGSFGPCLGLHPYPIRSQISLAGDNADPPSDVGLDLALGSRALNHLYSLPDFALSFFLSIVSPANCLG
jgi:hypothetical protein